MKIGTITEEKGKNELEEFLLEAGLKDRNRNIEIPLSIKRVIEKDNDDCSGIEYEV